MTEPTLVRDLFSEVELAKLAARVAKLNVPDPKPVVYDHYWPMMYDVHERLRPVVRNIVGVEVLPAYAVATIYQTGAYRPKRGFTTARSNYQMAVKLKQDGPGDLPVHFYGPAGEHLTLRPRLGDGVFIERGWEWERPTLSLSCGRMFIVTFHFVPATFNGTIE